MPAVQYDYDTLAEKARSALKEAFPESAIETEEGYLRRVHVRIVSPAFNGRSEREKQHMVWEVLEAEMGEDAQAVTLVLAYGMDELP